MVKYFLNSAFWNRISDLKLHLASENRKTKSSKKVFFKQKMWSLSHDTKCCNCCHRNYLPLATALALALSRSLSRSLSLSLSQRHSALSLSLSLTHSIIFKLLLCSTASPLWVWDCASVQLRLVTTVFIFVVSARPTTRRRRRERGHLLTFSDERRVVAWNAVQTSFPLTSKPRDAPVWSHYLCKQASKWVSSEGKDDFFEDVTTYFSRVLADAAAAAAWSGLPT